MVAPLVSGKVSYLRPGPLHPDSHVRRIQQKLGLRREQKGMDSYNEKVPRLDDQVWHIWS
jgi:hypothetical protein